MNAENSTLPTSATATAAGCPSGVTAPLDAPSTVTQQPTADKQPSINPEKAFALQLATDCARERAEIQETEEELQEALQKKQQADMETERSLHLMDIGLALSSERDIERLLDLILTKARELTDADAGSLYIVHKNDDAPAAEAKTVSEDGRTLYFRAAQNDSITVDTKLNFSVSKNTLAGYAALTGETINCSDAYALPEDAPYGFSPAWDQKHGYLTKSVLVVPMKNHAGEVIGVLQLINRKRNQYTSLRTREQWDHEVIPFDQETVKSAAALASQAAVALENNMLLQEVTKLLNDMETMLHSFILASASLIDDRDPPTSGHSERVTFLTVALAEAASQMEEGPFKDVSFTNKQLQELRYAGLLHDIGKIGVREYIFTKSHKLEPLYFTGVLNRFELLRRNWQLEAMHRKLAIAQTHSADVARLMMRHIDDELEADFQSMDNDIAMLKRANDPTTSYLPEEEFSRQQEVLCRLAKTTYEECDGEVRPLLTQDEVEALSVRKGSLTTEERRQMEHHAQMSYDFLKQITWTANFGHIPEIVWCHHEKLNGRGYPRGVMAENIPLQARMMTVADIFDALTAADRPYKKALPIDLALSILRDEAERGLLDRDVVALFIEKELYRHMAVFRPDIEMPEPFLQSNKPKTTPQST
ncbi:MAG: hypothetical protein JWN98_1904 [Abditibacteriota bacterium]|nr:hypothetical protein [Abditibacteriota bacterium]